MRTHTDIIGGNILGVRRHAACPSSSKPLPQSTSTTSSTTTITIIHPTMTDADEYEGSFLPDDYEEALYNDDDDDPDKPVVIEDNYEQGGERVVKLSFPGLIKFHHRNPEIKARFLDVVQKFVINNTEIAARASMILHYIVMYGID